MGARAQEVPTTGSGNAPAQTQSPTPAQNAAPAESEVPEQFPSNYHVVPNAKNGDISSEGLHPKIVESWITPSLEGSHFGPAQATKLGESGAVDNIYTHEIQRVMWREGDPIDLYIIKPVGVRKPPVILYL